MLLGRMKTKTCQRLDQRPSSTFMPWSIFTNHLSKRKTLWFHSYLKSSGSVTSNDVRWFYFLDMFLKFNLWDWLSPASLFKNLKPSRHRYSLIRGDYNKMSCDGYIRYGSNTYNRDTKMYEVHTISFQNLSQNSLKTST